MKLCFREFFFFDDIAGETYLFIKITINSNKIFLLFCKLLIRFCFILKTIRIKKLIKSPFSKKFQFLMLVLRIYQKNIFLIKYPYELITIIFIIFHKNQNILNFEFKILIVKNQSGDFSFSIIAR